MVAVIWAVVAAMLALVVVVAESMLGFHDPSSSAISPNVLWFIIPPIVVVAAMVHHRQRTVHAISYGAALRSGLLATLAVSVALSATWFAISTILVPDYSILLSAQRHASFSTAGADTSEVMGQAYVTIRLFTMPLVAVLGFVMPMVSGGIAALIAAVGIRKSA